MQRVAFFSQEIDRYGTSYLNFYSSEERQVAVGTRPGKVLIFDIPSASLFEEIDAHSAGIWYMHVSHDEQEVATGSADKEVKFWKITRITHGENGVVGAL